MCFLIVLAGAIMMWPMIEGAMCFMDFEHKEITHFDYNQKTAIPALRRAQMRRYYNGKH